MNRLTRWLYRHSVAIQIREKAIAHLKAENHRLSMLLWMERQARKD